MTVRTFAAMNTELGNDILKAAELLKADSVVAIPTETVYGLAANALSETAVVKIFEAKDRPFFDPLIVHIKPSDDPSKYVSYIPDVAKKLIERFWPGPLTLVLPKNDIIPAIVTAGQDTVGLRMPSQPTAQQLLESLNFPLAAPSANPFGYISPTSAQHVFDQLQGKIPYILDGGPCTVGVESTIIGFEKDEPIVYRLGGTPIEEIEAITGKIRLQINQSSNPSAPGQLKSHYAPGKPVLRGDIAELTNQYPDKKLAIISLNKAFSGENILQNWILSRSGNLEEAAINLFKALREADQSDADLIIAEIFPERGLGRAINDRLKRAAG